MPRSGIAGSYGGFIPRKGKKEKKRKNRYAKLIVIDKEDLYTLKINCKEKRTVGKANKGKNVEKI